MLIISVQITKIIDEREKCDAGCVVMRWSNSKEKMSIISVRDNENNRWKRDAKKRQTNKQTKAEKNKEGWKAIAKVLAIAKWFCCVFKLGFLQWIVKVF